MVLECGTNKGASTTVFIEACKNLGGQLVSIDVVDCSDIVESPNWQFIQTSDTNTDEILAAAPYLRDGINILYVDSVHRRDHVEPLVMRWFPYLQSGAVIFFDDVDPNPYRQGNRKDNLSFELDWTGVRDFTIEFLHANEDTLYMEHHFGSTGLAKVTKLLEIGTPANKAQPIIDRAKDPLRQLKNKIAFWRH